MTLPDVYGDEPESEPETHEPEVCLLGGWCGLHRFYVGKTNTALAMIPTVGGFGIWWFYDLVLIAAGEFRDRDDLPLRRWEVEESRLQHGALRLRAERRVSELEEQLDGLRQQFNELAERVDFAERMLAQHREPAPPRLPRGS
jgi:hypothetical protein